MRKTVIRILTILLGLSIGVQAIAHGTLTHHFEYFSKNI